MQYRANLIPINEYTTLIDDAGSSCAYLITGKEKALLIDTLNGVENLADIVRTITDLPVMVVNTHGHIDHAAGLPLMSNNKITMLRFNIFQALD